MPRPIILDKGKLKELPQGFTTPQLLPLVEGGEFIFEENENGNLDLMYEVYDGRS